MLGHSQIYAWICILPSTLGIGYFTFDFISSFICEQEGATEEEIDQFPKYKFRSISDFEKVNGEIQESFGGMMIECDTDTPIERVLSQEDAVSYTLWFIHV